MKNQKCIFFEYNIRPNMQNALQTRKNDFHCFFSALREFPASQLIDKLFFHRRQTIDLISDEQLAYVVLSTVFAHSVVWDKEREMYRLKMEGFEDLCLFEVNITNIFNY